MPDSAEAPLRYRLIGVLHDDPNIAHGVNDLEKTIRDMIEKGLHQITYFSASPSA
jgi:hypothetical protein